MSTLKLRVPANNLRAPYSPFRAGCGLQIVVVALHLAGALVTT